MSNYPPGVTGNEWQIAGADERVISVDCEAMILVDGEERECGFTGDVDAASVDGETWAFECPECSNDGEWVISLDPEDVRW